MSIVRDSEKVTKDDKKLFERTDTMCGWGNWSQETRTNRRKCDKFTAYCRRVGHRCVNIIPNTHIESSFELFIEILNSNIKRQKHEKNSIAQVCCKDVRDVEDEG